MTDYKAIHGKNILHVASDLGAEGEGEIWFNTASSDFKTIVKVAGAWASGGDINTARLELFGTGPGTAGLIANGTTDGTHGSQVTSCETYDGSSWTEVNDTDQKRQDCASAGVVTSALVTAGYTTSPQGNSAFTETFNGTSWAEETNITNGIQARKGLGETEDAALIVSSGDSSTCELWNGSSWTELADQNTARSGQGTFGTSTAGIGAGGYPYVQIVESWNGASWTEVGDINTGRNYQPGAGTQTNGLIFGGNTPPATGKTEAFDGTSWTEFADLTTARYHLVGGGTGGVAIAMGGTSGPTTQAATEEWDFTSTTTPPGAQNIKIITD